MQIRVGYELIYDCPQPTPMMLMLNIHHSRAADIVVPDHVMTEPAVPVHAYRDAFGNWCSRIVAPQGRIRICEHWCGQRHRQARSGGSRRRISIRCRICPTMS